MLSRLAILLFACVAPFLAMAQDDDDARAQLAGTEAAIKAADAKEKAISSENAKLEQELHSLQEETVNLARQSSEQEQELSSAEEKLAILEEQKKEKDKALSERQQELSVLISAMVKLKAMPPEAVIAMPGKLSETLSTARALSIVTETIEEDSESLKAQLDELDDLTRKIEKNHATILARKSELDAKHTNLATKIKERGKVQAELGNQSQKEKDQLVNLQQKSRSLQDLIDALGHEAEEQEQHETEKKEVEKKEKTPTVKHHGAHEIRSFASAKGRLRTPAAGKIVRRYTDGGDATAFSRGITISTPEDANVVAPFDGEVVYAGNFRDYGHIVIIRHSNDYHTLLSGMDHIDCEPGQFLLEGEPIGSMGEDKDARRLYMELRKNGKPVDPSPWLRPLS